MSERKLKKDLLPMPGPGYGTLPETAGSGRESGFGDIYAICKLMAAGAVKVLNADEKPERKPLPIALFCASLQAINLRKTAGYPYDSVKNIYLSGNKIGVCLLT